MFLYHDIRVLYSCVTERGVQGRNFEDRDFGFFAKVIICAQLAYLDGFALRMCGRAQQGAARTLVPFFSQYTRVTYHFVSNKVTLP